MSKSRLYFFSLFRKNTITFCTIWVIFGRKQGSVASQRARMKIWHILFQPHTSWSVFFKNNFKGFCIFSTILRSWEIFSNSVWSRKINWFKENIFSLINLVPKVPSFNTRTKFRLKNCVTSVTNIKQISSFIYTFKREIYSKS